MILSSCATLFNTRTQQVHIVTSLPSKIKIDKITSVSIDTIHHAVVTRQKKTPITITATHDSTTKTVTIKPHLSPTFWLNFGTSYGFGFLIDFTNQRRFVYPKYVYIDMTSDKHVIKSRYQTPAYTLDSMNNILKLTPLKLVGLLNPAIELSYERKTGKHFATQLMVSYLLPGYSEGYDEQGEGYKIGLEERYYYQTSAMKGFYLAWQIDYMQKKHKSQFIFEIPDTSLLRISYTEKVDVRKKTFSVAPKIGYQTFYKNRWLIDVYMGIGLRWREVKHFNRARPEDPYANYKNIGLNQTFNEETNAIKWFLFLPMNIRIGWAF